MNYTFSIHGSQRFEQRGFTKEILSILEFFGDYEHVIGNAERISISKKRKNDIIRFINKMIHYPERN